MIGFLRPLKSITPGGIYVLSTGEIVTSTSLLLSGHLIVYMITCQTFRSPIVKSLSSIATFLIGFSIAVLPFLTAIAVDEFNPFFHCLLLLLTCTYISFCISGKKILSSKAYSVIYFVITIAFVYLLTAQFGRYYFCNSAALSQKYFYQINAIMQNSIEDELKFLQVSSIYFDIGLEKYFSGPTVNSIHDIHFIQYYLGKYLLGAVLLTAAVEFIKNILGPDNTKPSEHREA